VHGRAIQLGHFVEAAHCTSRPGSSTWPDTAGGREMESVRIVKLTSVVNSTADFTEHHLVTNGASELFAEVFGARGAHARSAFGAPQLPAGTCLEIELIAEIVPLA
jgi:enamine deaminase RidA (YjgF/YER057c/UK114 family)